MLNIRLALLLQAHLFFLPFHVLYYRECMALPFNKPIYNQKLPSNDIKMKKEQIHHRNNKLISIFGSLHGTIFNKNLIPYRITTRL